MSKITLYKIVKDLKIEVNNKRALKFEFAKATTEKEYNQYLKITVLDAHGDKEKTIFINESDLVLLYNLYVYKKQNNEPIF